MRKIAEKLLAPINTSLISILGLFHTWTGLWLALPWRSFGKIYTDILFMPEWAIGLILFSIGVTMLYGALKVNLTALLYSTTAGYLFWLPVSTVLVYANPSGISWIASFIFAVYCFMVNLNIRVNKKHAR
jgi:hypothetical protein